MNAQIKDFAKRAGFVMWSEKYQSQGDFIDWSSRYDEELARFAELIVRECAEIALRENHEPSECILAHFGLRINND